MTHPGGNETKQDDTKFRRSGLEVRYESLEHRDGI